MSFCCRASLRRPDIVRGWKLGLSVSIVICTDGRVASLKQTLESLSQLIFRNFEVCVVYGPTNDGTCEILAGWRSPIKTVSSSARNLSMSRNLGIAISTGDIVAFLDDDAIPEPEWLDQIVQAYDRPSIGGAGGFVHDHTGHSFQYRFGTTDRLGRADLSWSAAAPELNFPYSNNFPHLLGANSSFRRSALLSVGGFDEEFEYYLDETDLAARIVDDGWHLVQIDGAYVHHKFMPSALRNEKRVLKSWYAIVKNRIYYGLVHRHGHHSISDVIDSAKLFIDDFRRDADWAMSVGYLSKIERGRFDEEIDRAWADGLARGLNGKRNLRSKAELDAELQPFIRYSEKSAKIVDKKTFCLMTQQYPPGSIGGVGRYIHHLAVGMAKLGHQVHVLTTGVGHNRVDLEDGVWVHRVVIQSSALQSPRTAAGPIPSHIWDYSSTVLTEIVSIGRRRRIDCVYAPIWDCEGIAVLRDGRFPLIVGLQTTFKFWMESHQERYADLEFVQTFLNPMIEAEKELLREASALHAISAAISREIELAYEVHLADRAAVIHLGLDDYNARFAGPSLCPMTKIRILFVGRLEARKGIDVLLNIAPKLLEQYKHVTIDIVGNDTIPAEDGVTFKDRLHAGPLVSTIRERVKFHGEVSEIALQSFYEGCDIFVAPSRFESFGLIFVEAMMFGKPVVGCRAGGMPEVIIEGKTGLLAEPGDDESLYYSLARLIEDDDLRRKLGVAGRERYEKNFTIERMASAVAALMSSVGHRDSITTIEPPL